MSEPTPPQPPHAQPPVAPPAYVPPAYPPAAQTPPYAAPGAYQPPVNPYAYGGYAAVQKTNTLSIVSMIASIAGFIWILPFVGSLAGAIMGHISLNQIKRPARRAAAWRSQGSSSGGPDWHWSCSGVIAFLAFASWAGTVGTSYNS